MKCDELKRYKAYEFGTSYVYHIIEVTEAIDELKQEIKYKDGVGKRWFDRCMEARSLCVKNAKAMWLVRARAALYATKFWKQKGILNEPLYFTIDCRCYEHGMKERTLRPSEWAKVWSEVERKCRAKAELRPSKEA